VRWNRYSRPAGADHRDARAVEGGVVIPLRGVERHAGERVEARDLGEVRTVELAHRAHHRVDHEGLVATVGIANDDRPRGGSVVPRGRARLGAEADVLLHTEVAGAVAEVPVEHPLVGVVERPVVPLRKGVAVVVVRVVDSATRIRVLVPGAADVVVLLDDGVGDAGLLEPVRGEDARHAGADDQHGEVAVGIEVGLAPLRAAAVVTPQRELLLQQRHVVVHVGAAHDVLHDLHEVVARRRRREQTVMVPEADERVEREVPCGGLLLGRHPALGEGEQVRIGTQVVAQQREVAGDVRERRQQRRDLGYGEVRAQLVVSGGDVDHVTCR
jgi:hypothetical protein